MSVISCDLHLGLKTKIDPKNALWKIMQSRNKKIKNRRILCNLYCFKFNKCGKSKQLQWSNKKYLHNV